MGDPACDRRFCPECDLAVSCADEVCPECGARIEGDEVESDEVESDEG